jgi:hypothetical protein
MLVGADGLAMVSPARMVERGALVVSVVDSYTSGGMVDALALDSSRFSRPVVR